MPLPRLDHAVTSPDLPDREAVAILKGYLSATLAAVRERRLTVIPGGGEGARAYAAAMDHVVRALYERAVSAYHRSHTDLGQELAVLAVGGYGRGELCPKSDVDILFLHPNKVDPFVETVTESMLYPLWDLGLDVGHAVRSVKEELRIASGDESIRSALLDYRLVTGGDSFYPRAAADFDRFLYFEGANRFIEGKVREMRERHEKHGATVYVLEPNLKEGRGGLRDLQAALWAARIKYKCRSLRELRNKGVVSARSADAYALALDYLLTVRTALHFQTGKKSDLLTFDVQEQLAEAFGYRDRGPADYGVERFMRSYYLRSVAAAALSDELLDEVDRYMTDALRRPLTFFQRKRIGRDGILYKGKIQPADGSSLRKEPIRILEFFRAMQKGRAELSPGARRELQRSLPAVTPAFREDPAAAKLFLEILADPVHLRETLLAMNETRFLGRYIPECAAFRCRVQRDVYHVWTVDIHSIRAATVLPRLELKEGRSREEEEFVSTFRAVPRRELLVLAVLFHDIGKGRGGHNHSKIGAPMAERAARRLGLSEEEVSDVEFLVREHLAMAHISQRRDLHDLDLVVDFAGRVGSTTRLDQLFLLTYSDMRAVGPDVWNDWKAMLLSELWQKSRHVLEHGALKSPLAERARTRREEVREILAGEPEGDVERFLSRFDDRYFLSTPDVRLPEHLALLRRFDGTTPVVELYEAPGLGTSELVIACPDRRGLFSTIAGTLSADGINIHNASIATSLDGVALDVFYVSFLGKGIDEPGKAARLARNLQRVLSGETTVEALLAERPAGRFSREKVSRYRPTRAVFDNRSSARCTVLEVFTYDRLGLLYDITSALSSLGIDIFLSKISTKGDQVADVFYITGPDGGKIEGDEEQEKVRGALLEAISRE